MMRCFDRQPSVGVTRAMQIAADAYITGVSFRWNSREPGGSTLVRPTV